MLQGTTGQPKAAVLNHMRLVNNTISIVKRIGILDDVDKVIKNNLSCSVDQHI